VASRWRGSRGATGWAPRGSPGRFHPVRLATPEGEGGAAIEIHLVGGHRVRVPPGFSE